MKAYGIPIQSVVWKQSNSTPATASVTGNGLIGAFVKEAASTSAGSIQTVASSNTQEADSSSVNSRVTIKQEVSSDGLEGCHLSSKQLEEFMDDDCHNPVSSGDPMLSSPHLSPHGVLPSPASSGSHYSANDDALTPPDSMDLAV